jgi:hypothetical protein
MADRPTAWTGPDRGGSMRRAAIALLMAGVAVAGCTHPTRNAPSASAATGPTKAAPTPSTQPAPMMSIRGRSARPAGWKAVRYRGLSFFVPATWRVRDGRRFPCPGMLSGPAVVLGHSKFIPPCPMPQLRTPLLWIDGRIETNSQPPRPPPGSMGWPCGCCGCTPTISARRPATC